MIGGRIVVSYLTTLCRAEDLRNAGKAQRGDQFTKIVQRAIIEQGFDQEGVRNSFFSPLRRVPEERAMLLY